MKPLVSIIIPLFNAENYIAQTIESVIIQSYTNWELVIINDGSTDNSISVIQNYLADKRINVFFQKNSGVSQARNNGIERAQGEFIAFLDADDYWMPSNLDSKINCLILQTDFDWVYSYEQRLFEDSNKIKETTNLKEGEIVNLILEWENEVVPSIASNIVLRKRCFETNLRFDKNLTTAADQDFILNLANKYEGKLIKEILFTYRIVKGSMSRNIKKLETDHIYVFNKAKKNKLFFSKHFERKCFSNLYLIIAGNWWVHTNKKNRAFYFIIRSLLLYPKNVSKIINKFI